MTTKRDKKIELIAQLLAKAESTTPEEAEALTAAAEKLMIQHQIERAEVAAASPESRDTTIVERWLHMDSKTYAAARCWSLSLAINALEQVTTFWNTNKRTGYMALVIVGATADADAALRLARSLDRQQMHAMRLWWKAERRYHEFSTAHEKLQERRGFIVGFGSGAAQRIADAREEATETLAESTALVLVGDRQRLDEHMQGYKITPTRAGVPGTAIAFGDGQREGIAANINAPELGAAA